MPRTSLSAWIRAVMSKHGPTPSRLRHACHVLATFMRGDGSEGCFPAQRTVADAMGVAQRTAGRDLERLEEQGWVETQSVKRQFGRLGKRFYPAVPDNESSKDDSIRPSIESSKLAHSGNESCRNQHNESFGGIIESNASIIESPRVAH